MACASRATRRRSPLRTKPRKRSSPTAWRVLSRFCRSFPRSGPNGRRRQSRAASFFLVDPLDGTREFIAGRSEYTINIGLICEGAPILGVIAAPALGLIWRGIVGRGAERLEFSERETSPPQAIRARSRPEQGLRVMVSRSHLDPQTQAYLNGLRGAQSVPCGSSVKFCRLAEGTADLYPRFAPTRDWDVAAGHAILAAAGGRIVTPDGAALTYGSPPLRIPAFLAAGDPALLSVRR